MGSTSLRNRGVRKSLSDRQRMFVVEYVKDFNGTRAAREVGYKNPQVSASNLLKLDSVKNAVGAIQKKTIERKVIERDGVIAKLHDSLYRDLCDLCDKDGYFHSKLTDIPKRAHAYIAGFEVYQDYDEEGNITGQKIKIKLTAPEVAQDMAMKHVGGYAPLETHASVALDWSGLYGPPKEKEIDVVEFRIQNPTAEIVVPPKPDAGTMLQELIEQEEEE